MLQVFKRKGMEMDGQMELHRQMAARLDRLEALLDELVRQRSIKDWYETSEVARILNKAKFTVREWCRHGRIHCKKKNHGRGKYRGWVIPHEEIQRICREGLLPLKTISTRI